MFHVLLALPVLASFGAMAVVVLSAVLAVWGAAFAMELALGLLCRRNRWCLWIPAGVGAVTTAVLAKHVVEAAERSAAK